MNMMVCCPGSLKFTKGDTNKTTSSTKISCWREDG